MSVNAARLSAGETFDILLSGWEAQAAGRLTASWMLHGRPGVGKTMLIRRLAERIGAKLFDLRLTTIEPQDLRGLPYYDHAAKRTVWYRPEDLPDDPAAPSILFLDELTAAQPALQPTVYGLLQERRVGRHELPASVFIVAAGNSVEDGAVAYEMGTALSDRLIHLVVRADAEDWIGRYAPARGIDPSVVAFLRARPDLFETTEEALRRGLAVACTPRSWERASDAVRAFPERRLRNAVLSGVLGEAVAAEFALVADEVAATVRLEEMLAAPRRERAALYPDTLAGLTALAYGLSGAARPGAIDAAIEIMADLRHLPRLRNEPAFAKLPLGELAAFGFELLIAQALAAGLEGAFARSSAWAEYSAERAAAGLG